MSHLAISGIDWCFVHEEAILLPSSSPSFYPSLLPTLTSPHPHFSPPSLPPPSLLLTLTSSHPHFFPPSRHPHFSSPSPLTLYLCTCSWSMGFSGSTGAEGEGTVFGSRAASLTRIYDPSELHRMPILNTVYSGTPLNGHPSTADTHDITDNSGSPDCPPFTSILKQPMNSGHPATLYNGQLSQSQLYANNT